MINPEWKETFDLGWFFLGIGVGSILTCLAMVFLDWIIKK